VLRAGALSWSKKLQLELEIGAGNSSWSNELKI